MHSTIRRFALRPNHARWIANLALAAALLAGSVLLGQSHDAAASSHREAPLISRDPYADTTDVYAFVSPDRPDTDFVRWYIARKERLIDLIWNHARALLEAGTNPVLELGLIQRQSREAFYERVRTADAELVVYVLDAPRDVRRERVRRRNLERGSTFFAVVPDHIFEMASDLWEPPDEDEIAENHIQLVSTPIGAVAGTR